MPVHYCDLGMDLYVIKVQKLLCKYGIIVYKICRKYIKYTIIFKI